MACSSSASSSPTSSSKKQTNCTRLCRLIIDIGRCVLQDVFDYIHKPAYLSGVLNSSGVHKQLQTLQSKRVLYSYQWETLYPPTGSSVKSTDFDISLLDILLRNICGLHAPATGWDKAPSSADKSMEADLIRIKQCRNNLAHITEFSLDEGDFQKTWTEIADALIRLGGVKYQEMIQKLKIDSMDHEDASHYISILRSWENRDDILLDEMKKIAQAASNSYCKGDLYFSIIIIITNVWLKSSIIRWSA